MLLKATEEDVNTFCVFHQPTVVPLKEVEVLSSILHFGFFSDKEMQHISKPNGMKDFPFHRNYYTVQCPVWDRLMLQKHC